MLALEWRDIDLENGYAHVRAGTTKGKRDAVVYLHQTVREHIATLRQATDPRERVFTWNDNSRKLYDTFHAIQRDAGINLPCRIEREHECSESCHVYGFHDLRRSFATRNALNMSREALRVLMRHSSEQTTAGYVNYAQQIAPAAANLNVPSVLISGLPQTESEANL